MRVQRWRRQNNRPPSRITSVRDQRVNWQKNTKAVICLQSNSNLANFPSRDAKQITVQIKRQSATNWVSGKPHCFDWKLKEKSYNCCFQLWIMFKLQMKYLRRCVYAREVRIHALRVFSLDAGVVHSVSVSTTKGGRSEAKCCLNGSPPALIDLETVRPSVPSCAQLHKLASFGEHCAVLWSVRLGCSLR